MQEYKEYVKEMARLRTGESFYNNSVDHASAIIETLFETAQREVCFLTTALNPEVFGREDVVEKARLFLSDAKHDLRILIETNPSETVSPGHPLVEEMHKHHTVQMRQLPAFLTADIPYHFTVADADSFRYEPDKQRWVASAAFGDERSGRKLQTIFDSVWEISQPVGLPN